MQRTLKKIVTWFLISLVLLFTVIAILGIWDVIDVDEVLRKILASLLVIFAASAVILFIVSVIGKELDKPDQVT
ncbi:MAG: hypothetical protein GXO83_03745 [Chlorobi bacterium]|nr:hypothetical protein [Chlorobiota bacterium]